MLQKSATAEVFCSTEQPFINLQDYFNLTRVTHTERSQVAYLEVMDAISDRKDTIFFWNRKSNILAVFLPACTICNWNVALHTRLTLGHISGWLCLHARISGLSLVNTHNILQEASSPESHYKSLASTQSALAAQQYRAWVEDIRQRIWNRITLETEMIPSTEALWHHWTRSCWIIDM